jgi:tetratricopeptide (TPR) repeat protein
MNKEASPSPAEAVPAPLGAPAWRYRAFISYSHRDKRAVSWLHGALERFRVPKRLVGQDGPWGPVPARLTPIFRDRDELPASGNLGAELMSALAGSQFLLVVASPASARSRWCNEEILAFKRTHGPDRVLALVVDGEPNAKDPEKEALAPALRFQVGPDGQLSDIPAEPIAADMRREADGRRLAFLKIVAGLTGVRLDELVQREAQRRARRLTWIASGALAGMTLTSGLAAYAYLQRNEAIRQRAIAEQESATARATADYLVGTFQLINPATENPRTISAFDLLSRSADRAAAELQGEPEVLVRITDSLAQAYMNLGLHKEAETVLVRTIPQINRAGAQGALALSTLSENYLRQGNTGLARRTLTRAVGLLPESTAEDGSTPDLAASAIYLAMARVERADGKSKESLQRIEESLSRLRASDSRRPLQEARIFHNKAQVLGDTGNYEAAAQSFEQAGNIYLAELGPRHRSLGELRYDQAVNALIGGKYEEALRLAAVSRGILDPILDPDNPFRAHVLALEGQILYDKKEEAPARRQRDIAVARNSLERAVAIYERSLGQESYVLAIPLQYLGLIAAEQGSPLDGLRYLDRAEANFAASYDSENVNHVYLYVYRAQVLARAGRSEEATRFCSRAVALSERLMGPEAYDTNWSKKECASVN